MKISGDRTMNTNKKLPFRLGMRTIKTSIAVGISLLVGSAIQSDFPPFLAIGALGTMQPSITASLKSARNLTIGNLIGALLAMAFNIVFSGNYALGGALGVVIMIVVCNALHMRAQTINLACVVFCCCYTNYFLGGGSLLYGLSRFRDTVIGTGIALAVNMCIRPYSGAAHTKGSIVKAQKAMLPLLEERVLRGRIPDLRDLRTYIIELDNNVNVLLDERWNKSLKKSEVAHLRGCQQLLWKMRDALIGICCIDTMPTPSPDNLARIHALGLTGEISQTGCMLHGTCCSEDTVVFNYYLKIFLDSNDYLTMLLEQ